MYMYNNLTKKDDSTYLNLNVGTAAATTGALGLGVQEVVDGVTLKRLLVHPGNDDVTAYHDAPLRVGRQTERHVLIVLCNIKNIIMSNIYEIIKLVFKH